MTEYAAAVRRPCKNKYWFIF